MADSTPTELIGSNKKPRVGLLANPELKDSTPLGLPRKPILKVKNPGASSRAFAGWPGQLVVRGRERGIASAQEVAGSIRILTGDLLSFTFPLNRYVERRKPRRSRGLRKEILQEGSAPSDAM